MNLFKKIFSRKAKPIEALNPYPDPYGFDGSKFLGGIEPLFRETDSLDYWALRKRSSALYHRNLYVRGIVARFITNVINTGLSLEAIPEELILGLAEGSLNAWCEEVENRFGIWSNTPSICDYKGERNFGALQRQIYLEALVGGDCLVVIRVAPSTNLPQIQIIPGDRIVTPFLKIAQDKQIIDGVELDERGRKVAYWVDRGFGFSEQDRFIRIEAYGGHTNRPTAFLVYGIDKREDSVRGMPLYGAAIQLLKEIDKYRDSAQRKAQISSALVGYIKRTQDGIVHSTLTDGGATRRVLTKQSTETGALPMKFAEVLPGVFMERLQPGEEPSVFPSGADVNFGDFEASIIYGIAWALEMPPEIMTLSFKNNYSASQAAVNEFKMKLNQERARLGCELCDVVYSAWFTSEVLLDKFKAPGYLEAYNNPTKYDIVRAWTLGDWTGAIKPAIDLVKLVSGYKLMVEEGFMDRARASRELTGTKYSKNIRRLQEENRLKASLSETDARLGLPEEDEENEEARQRLLLIAGDA